MILVVEDDSLVSEVVSAVLEDSYLTEVVETSAAALARLRQGGVRLMLLDCTLPDGIDPDLVPEADRVGAAVILMSGDAARMSALADPPRPFLLKPFTLNGLLETVESVLAGTASP